MIQMLSSMTSVLGAMLFNIPTVVIQAPLLDTDVHQLRACLSLAKDHWSFAHLANLKSDSNALQIQGCLQAC